MAFSPPEYCRLFAQKKAYQGGVMGTPGPPPPSLATPLDFSFDMLHVIEQTVSGTWKLLNQERSKKGSISEARASDHRHSLKKYESRDHITEQDKRVVPRKGKGVKKKKGKQDKKFWSRHR